MKKTTIIIKDYIEEIFYYSVIQTENQTNQLNYEIKAAACENTQTKHCELFF